MRKAIGETDNVIFRGYMGIWYTVHFDKLSDHTSTSSVTAIRQAQ